MSLPRSLARLGIALLLTWQVAEAGRFVARDLCELDLDERRTLLTRSSRQRAAAVLGDWTPAWEAVLERVPEDATLMVVSPPDPDQVQTYLKLIGLLYPRRLPGAAVTRADTDLSVVRFAPEQRVWVLDMDSGFGLPLDQTCELVTEGPRFQLWRWRTE